MRSSVALQITAAPASAHSSHHTVFLLISDLPLCDRRTDFGDAVLNREFFLKAETDGPRRIIGVCLHVDHLERADRGLAHDVDVPLATRDGDDVRHVVRVGGGGGGLRFDHLDSLVWFNLMRRLYSHPVTLGRSTRGKCPICPKGRL